MTNLSKREVSFVVAMAVLGCMTVAQAAITCTTVTSDLLPCVGYLQDNVASPPARCCDGVRSLYTATKGLRSDRITACKCIKTLASAFAGNLDSNHIKSLPGSCGINLGYTITLSIDCNSIP